MNKSKDTVFMANELNSVTSLSEGLRVISQNSDATNEKSFSEFFNEYLAAHSDLKPSTVINNSGLTRSFAHDIINGTKKASRDRIIALCFAARMNKIETNYALKFAGHNELYDRNLRDQHIILAINLVQQGNRDYNTVLDLNIMLDEQNQEPLDI